MFRHLILGLLRDGSPSYAYALATDERLFDSPSYPSNAGRELRRLKEEGLVARISNAPGDDERQVRYVITSEGTRVFDGWLTSLAALEEDFSTWLRFMDRVPPETRDNLLAQREEDLWLELKRINRRRENTLTRHCGNGSEPFSTEAACLRRLAIQLSGELEFIRELREQLSSPPPQGPKGGGVESVR